MKTARGILLTMVITLAMPLSVQAEPRLSVPRDGFECLIRHAATYIERGPEIYINFETCPKAPGFVEELEIAQAENVFPTRRVRQEDSGTGTPKEVSKLVLSPDMLLCLRKHRSDILDAATADRVFIAPDACLP